MSIADISREKWAFAQEDSFGVQVTGTGRYLQTMRITSESLKQAADIVASREIRSDRQTAAIARTRVAVAGDIAFELSYASFDDFLAAALMSANVKAQGTLTLDTNPIDANGDTMTIGTTTYRFKDTLAQANDIKIGATVADTQASIVKTLNGTGVAGTDYYAGTVTPHPLVRAGSFATNNCVITALAAGIAGNSIATTETFTAATNLFDAGTLGTTRAGAGWTAPVTVISSGTVSAVASGNKFTIGTAWTVTPTANQWIKVSGFVTAANNGCFKVVSASTTEIVVSGGTLVNEADKTGVTIKQGSSIVNGVTKNSFNLERTYTDLSSELALYVGCMMNQLTLTVGTNALVTGSLAVMGKIETSETASGGAGYEAANANEILNSIDHVMGIYENLTAVNVLDFNMNLVNNLRERLKVGTLGAFDMGTGQVQVSGTFTAYYESKTLYDKYLDFDSTSLAKVFQDTAGNGYVIDLPSVKVTDAQRHAGAGLGDDFKVPCTWQAFRDASEDITIRIVRFAA